MEKLDNITKANVLAASLVTVMAILGLLGCISGLRLLGSVHKGYIPMAPSTAMCFLLQGVILIRLAYRRWREPERFIMRALSGLTALFGLLEVLGHFMGFDLNFEDMLVPTMGQLGEIPIGRMSPLTGVLFFFTGICVLLLVPRSHPPENRPMHGAGLVGGLVIISSFIEILSYLMGTPLLYEYGATVPMALTTAFCFFCLGTAIVAAAGKNSLPLRILTGHSTRARLLRVFLPLVVVAVLIESIAYRFIPALFPVNPAFIAAITIVVGMVITGLMVNWASASLGLAIDQAEEIRKKAEAALRESEKRFRDLVENSLIGISIIQDNQIVYQNPQQEKLFGPLPRPNMLTDIENIHPDDIEKVKAFYKNLTSGKVQIQEMVLNLLNNAAEAMKTMEDGKKIVVVSFEEDDRIIIQVSDSGPGVPEEIRDKILDPYFTTKQEGTAIGLSLCHRIIQDHGGSIDVSPGKWGGAEFHIEIPTRVDIL